MKKLAASLFSVLLLCASVAFVQAQVGGGVYGPPSVPVAGGTMTGALVMPAGSASLPSITGADTSTGIWFRTSGAIDVSAGGNHRLEIAGTSIRAGSGTSFCFSSASAPTASCDASVSRTAAGIVGIGTAAAANDGIVQANRARFNKITDPATASGAGTLDLRVVAGTNAGSCKIVAYAGTSTTPVTVIDNVGSGC